MEDPPEPYEEVSHCRVCTCTFTTFKHRHHCRACRRSLCNEHSSNQKANVKRISGKNIGDPIETTSASISKMSMSWDEVQVAPTSPPTTPAMECTCGMALCICEAPTHVASHPCPALEMRSPSPSSTVQQVKARKA